MSLEIASARATGRAHARLHDIVHTLHDRSRRFGMEHTIETMVAEDEKVWVKYTIQGTHEGLYRNVPGTHKQVSSRCIALPMAKSWKPILNPTI